MARFRMRGKKANIPMVVSKVAGTVLALYAGGVVINTLGEVMTNTSSPFYKGLSLIGWTTSTTYNATATSCGTTATLDAGESAIINNCLTTTTGAGVLAVVGIIGIASIVMEFVEFRL